MMILMSVRGHLLIRTRLCGNQFIDLHYEPMGRFVRGAAFNAGRYFERTVRVMPGSLPDLALGICEDFLERSLMSWVITGLECVFHYGTSEIK